MNVLVTGSTGQLGQAICAALEKQHIAYRGIHSTDCDIKNPQAVDAIFRNPFDAVIHCAAYSKVDQAEENAEVCYQINVYGTSLLAKACQKCGAYLLYISSDYVFDGTKAVPYEVDDTKNPLSVYGKSKDQGEDVVLQSNPQNAVLRVSWLFGHSKDNFVCSILHTAQSRKRISVVSDQYGSPTYAADLAPLILEMIIQRPSGIFHGTNEGETSRADFARAILKRCAPQVTVEDISSEAYSAKAKRPSNSCLSKKCLDSAGFHRLPHWEDALDRYLREDFQYDAL